MLVAALTQDAALAQEEPPAEAAPAPEVPAAPAQPAAEAAPVPAPTPEPAPTPAPAPAEPAPPALEAAPPQAPMAEPEPMPLPEPVEAPPAELELAPVSVGVWLRAGMKLQNPRQPEKLNDLAMDGVYAELHTSGQVHEVVNWTFNLNGNASASDGADAAGIDDRGVGIMDLIVQFDLSDPFHLWIGQHLVPSDRSNFSGPFFMSPWNYPGLVGPRQGGAGRNLGTTAWGDFGEGTFKYYAGVFDLEGGPASRPLYTGRLNLALVGAEPGFYHSSTYYGAQDVLAIGVAGQYQGQTPLATDNYAMFNADLLAEFTAPGAGTFTAEAAYYLNQEVLSVNGLMLLGSYLTPSAVGPGKLQVGARYQGRWEEDAVNSPVTSVVDAWLAYVIRDYNLRVTANYERIDRAGEDGNAVVLGVQTIQ